MTETPDSASCPLVPLVVAVTGHRDLLPEDEAKDSALRETLRTCLRELEERHAHTPLILLTGLAEGADCLAAEEALACGHEVVAVLPHPPAEFETSFETPRSTVRFRALLARCKAVVQTEPTRHVDDHESAPYVAVGEFLVLNSDVLIALWDGESSASLGGTHHVVEMMLNLRARPGGIDLSDATDAGHVIHVPVVRRSGREPAERGVRSLVAAGIRTSEMYARVLSRIDDLNGCLRDIHARSAAGVAESRGWLVGQTPRNAWQPAEGLVRAYAHVDRLAIEASHRTTTALRTVTGLATGTGLFFLLYTDHKPWPVFLLTYILLLVTTTWFLMTRIRRSDVKNQFLDFRALAEGLRVAVFWRLGGIQSQVADQYLRTPAGDLLWIRRAIGTWSLLERVTDVPDMESAESQLGRLEVVTARWIHAQEIYFEDTSAKRARMLRRVDMVERLLLAGALACSLAMAVTTLAPALLAVAVHSNPAALFSDNYLPVSDDLQFGAGLLLLGVAMCMAYAGARAYREEAQEYARMAALFRRAGSVAERVREERSIERRILRGRELIEVLGREALRENAQWLLLHRDRPLTAQIG